MSMTIEEIRALLQELSILPSTGNEIIESIAAIRTDAYDKGWDDAQKDTALLD